MIVVISINNVFISIITCIKNTVTIVIITDITVRIIIKNKEMIIMMKTISKIQFLLSLHFSLSLLPF
jgi:hypothetical protein